MKVNSLSVFFPAYNLENQIKKTVSNAYKFIPNFSKEYEIIVVNDGSTDNTQRSLAELKKKYKDLIVVNHKKNRGYGGALQSGMYSATKEWVAFTDGDGQFDLSEIDRFFDKQAKTGADIVVGYYNKRRVNWSVILTSKMWEAVVYIFFGIKVKDIDCGFKLIRRDVIEKIPRLESQRGAFISSEFLVKAKRAGFKISEVGVSHYARDVDKDSATGRDFRVILQSFKDLFKLWIKYK